MSVTCDTSQFEMSTLKDVAPRNMRSMLVTRPTFQFEMSPLKGNTLWNIELMSVTRPTSQFEMSPLKSYALENIARMSVTRDTSQFEMSPLKCEAPNIPLMSVTSDTSQVPIGPRGPLEQSVDSLRHASTECLSSCRLFGVNRYLSSVVRGETPWTVVPAASAGGSAINITKAMNREKVATLVRGVMGIECGFATVSGSCNNGFQWSMWN